VEQFARERQILARLQHLNIAHLFDGGVSAEGLSYFVMELVEGRPISQYAVEERLPIRPLLLLFRQVCSAVQYAHVHLVVHADIKPNNILVTADGTAKLLDFGVARVIADVGDPAAAPSGSLGITHYYASPARRRGEVPSTIDDVYSLGVLLRELFRPFQAVSAELRSICERACAEDPSARYASVDALKGDIERWMDGLPVHAHGTAWAYVASKFLARHRLAVGSAAAGVLLLVGAASALAVLYMRAERAKIQAEQRFNDVRDLSRYVLFDNDAESMLMPVTRANPQDAEAPYREQYQLLQGLAEEEPQNLRAARAFMRAGWALGSTLLDLGKDRAEEAERILSASYELAGRLRLLEPDDKDLVRMASIAAASEARALAVLGRADQGLPILEYAVGARRLLWKEAPEDWAVARDYAVSLKELGDTRLLAHQPVSACANYREALDVFARMRAAGRMPKLDEDYTLKPLNEGVARICTEPVAAISR
jgi:hypothetical protein